MRFGPFFWGKWLTAQMWDGYINKNHPLSDASPFDATMLHHDVSYDPTLRNIYLNVNMNDNGVYHHYLTGKNTSTIHCYQVQKKGEARYDHEVKTGCY